MESVDRELKELITTAIDGLPAPDTEKAWDKVATRLQPDPQKPRLRLLLPAAAGLVIFVIVSSLIFHAPASAFGRYVFNTLDRWLGGTLRNISSSYTPIEEFDEVVLPSKSTVPDELIFPSFSAAEDIVPFPILIPTWLPEGFSLDHISVTSFTNEDAQMRIVYSGSDVMPLTIVERNLAGAMGRGQMYDTDDARAREVSVQGSPGTLLQAKTGYLRLSWIAENLAIDINGRLSEADVLKVAESLEVYPQ